MGLNSQEVFNIEVWSDQDHEDLIAEIYYQGDFVCQVTQESGFDYLDIALYPRKDGKPWEFKLAEFEPALSHAKNRLWELRKVEGNTSGQQ